MASAVSLMSAPWGLLSPDAYRSSDLYQERNGSGGYDLKGWRAESTRQLIPSRGGDELERFKLCATFAI
jgi:hypothetical protein